MDEQLTEDDASRPGIADSHLHLVRTWYLECRSDHELQPVLQDVARAPWFKLKNRITEKEIRRHVNGGGRVHRLATGRYQVDLNEAAGSYSPYGRKQADRVFDVVEVPLLTELPNMRLFTIEPIAELLVTAATTSATNLIKAAHEGETADDDVWVPIIPQRRSADKIGEPLAWTRLKPGILEFGFYLHYIPRER